MNELIENLREFKALQERNISENEAIIDVSYYGRINLSKKDNDISNERKEDLYLVKKEINGKIELVFCTNNGKIATVGEDGQITIAPGYVGLINEKEFLLQLRTIMPVSLEKLQEIEQKRTNKQGQNKEETSKSNVETSKSEVKEQDNSQEPKKYIPNAKDVKIDMNKKITETKTFAELVPEVKQKGIVDVVARRTKNMEFEMIGINSQGEELPLTTLVQTEGTNPTKDIIEINQDGSQVKKEQVMTMLKIKNGENQAKQDEGFTINLGSYGIPEINYYRRARETNEYTSIPVNLENTNQKRTEREVREYMEKKRNTSVEDNIVRAEDRISYNEEKETQLENIDDNPYNDNIVDESEIIIRKAATRCKVTVEEFKQELEKQDGNSLEEKIENAEDEINEQFRGSSGHRA